jgi:hypothetical protein
MTSHVLASPRLERRAFSDTIIALLVWAVVAAVLAAKVVPELATHGLVDPDSQMRLVEVRDYLAGAAWTDLTQMRLDPPTGVLMHWSRLVDWPLAALIRMTQPFVGRDMAELIAVTVWPLGLFLVFTLGILSTIRTLGGKAAVLPAIAFAVCAGPAMGTFLPGHITHHNVQLALFAVLLALAVQIARGEIVGVIAGLVAAVSLSVGLETLALIGIVGGGLALAWAFEPARMRQGVNAFSLFFAAGMTVQRAFAVTPQHWLDSACDIASAPYVAVALVGGFGLAGLIWLNPASLVRRFAGLALIGVVAVAVMAGINPTCLKGPYAQVDPRLIPLWLDHIEEAGSFDAIIRSRPFQVLGLYFTPFLALIPTALAFTLAPRAHRAAWGLVLALLVTAIAVSLWQVRGATFAALLAVPGIACAVSDIRRKLEPGNPLVLAGALLVAYVIPNQTIGALAGGYIEARLSQASGGPTTQPAVSTHEAYGHCAARETYAGLSLQPPGLVLAESNLGPSILLNTAHSVLGAPYHRNTTGLIDGLTALEAQMGDAYQIVARRHVAYVALCPEDPEMTVLRDAGAGRNGLAMRLLAGDIPDWLVPVATTGPLKLWRVVDPALAGLPDKTMTGAALPRGRILPGSTTLRGTITPVTPQEMP